MGFGDLPPGLRVGWWAEPELVSPLDALCGSLLRAELACRCPGLRPVLIGGRVPSATMAGFGGDPWSAVGVQALPSLDVMVLSGSAEPGGPKAAERLSGAGASAVAVAPRLEWGQDERLTVGAPFGVPEPTLLAARHLPRALLDARLAYLRVVEGLPRWYVLVEEGVLEGPDGAPAEDQEDLALALAQLARRAGAGEGRPAEVVVAMPGPLGDDPTVEQLLAQRRSEVEEGRFQPEDWQGNPGRPQAVLRVTNPVDLAAAVAGAGAVVARTGSFMAMAWALGTPHVALGQEGSSPSDFAAWTGDASALATSASEVVATMDSIFARRGEPPGLRRLEATLDQSMDEAAERLLAVAELAVGAPSRAAEVALEERVRELETANEALRSRLADERLRFGERAALLEKAADTSVESAIKAVHGQDVVIRRRLEETEREMRRLQEETAVQQAELRAIHASFAMRALTPARELYGRFFRPAP